jgi:hypothetical protein
MENLEGTLDQLTDSSLDDFRRPRLSFGDNGGDSDFEA